MLKCNHEYFKVVYFKVINKINTLISGLFLKTKVQLKVESEDTQLYIFHSKKMSEHLKDMRYHFMHKTHHLLNDTLVP